jgi:hypothetical protein
MLVINKSTGLITIGATHVPTAQPGDDAMAPEVKARLAKRLALAHGEVSLVPGPNEVDDATWAKLTDEKTGNATVRHIVDTEVLVARRGVNSIKDVKSLDEAVKLVAATGDSAMLDKWLEVETRRKVIDAIEKQKSVIAGMLKAAEASA